MKRIHRVPLKVEQKIEELKMLHRISARLEMLYDMDRVAECHYLMNSIIEEITPWKSYIWEKRPDFKNIFNSIA